ncbi:MAG TPA: YvcK family protein [Candidatus Avoscillospira stercoripullorum]|uniref:Putative gluconeogenesis factor n=1 Tax=Candidatus Avoscillospira stercoripullorum TaxID=2840709 RepID=A0A9D1AAL0_9FIRM|nr:YvcK family protein [Candidatus Avoscillospira stercoripullorum]
MYDEVKVYVPGRKELKIVAIGGGHGLSTMLRGLKRYTKDITAIVTVADDGGGSGMLREDLGILPPGDIRNCILALANTEPTMEQLLNYRFTEGSLAGQSFGNLFLAAMDGISGSFDEAVHRMGEVLAITGRVLPVTNQSVHLEAEFVNGSRVLGESKIFYAKKRNDCRIRQVRLVPEHPKPLPESIEAIAQADLILLGPGSLYTSIIPNLLVDGVAEAIAKSRALKILVMNIMTQDGESDGYTGADHVRALLHHGAPGIIDVCIANNAVIGEAILAPYRQEGVEQLRLEREEIEAMGIQVEEYPMATGERYIRHDTYALASAIMEVYRRSRPTR